MANWLYNIFTHDSTRRLATAATPAVATASPRAVSANAPTARTIFTAPSVAGRTLGQPTRARLAFAFENLVNTFANASVSDVGAAAVDFTRAAHAAGENPRALLNAHYSSRVGIAPSLARTRTDVNAKLDILMAMGFKLDRLDPHGRNLLHDAAGLGNEALIDAMGARANSMSRALVHGATADFQHYLKASPLAFAVHGRHANIVLRLVRLGADPAGPCCTSRDGAELSAQQLCLLLDTPSRDMLTAVRLGRPSR